MGLGGALIKSVRGVISKYQKPAGQRTVKATVVTDTKNKTTSNSKTSGNGGGIRALALDGDAAGILQNYYGFDLTSIPNLDEGGLIALVDYLRQAEWMDEHLPTLEKHFDAYIERQIKFNEFVTRVTKSGVKGAEKIDKLALDTYLAAKGYTANSQKLSQDSRVGVQLLDQKVSNYIDLSEYDFAASLKNMAAKLAAEKAAIDADPEKAQERRQIAEQKKAEKDRIKNLITYGTAPVMAIGGGSSSSDMPVSPTSPSNNGGGGTGIFGKMKDFFNGK